jgi:hypothetical protein
MRIRILKHVVSMILPMLQATREEFQSVSAVFDKLDTGADRSTSPGMSRASSRAMSRSASPSAKCQLDTEGFPSIFKRVLGRQPTIEYPEVRADAQCGCA